MPPWRRSHGFATRGTFSGDIGDVHGADGALTLAIALAILAASAASSSRGIYDSQRLDAAIPSLPPNVRRRS